MEIGKVCAFKYVGEGGGCWQPGRRKFKYEMVRNVTFRTPCCNLWMSLLLNKCVTWQSVIWWLFYSSREMCTADGSLFDQHIVAVHWVREMRPQPLRNCLIRLLLSLFMLVPDLNKHGKLSPHYGHKEPLIHQPESPGGASVGRIQPLIRLLFTWCTHTDTSWHICSEQFLFFFQIFWGWNSEHKHFYIL